VRIATGQFNEAVQGDVVYVKDVAGETHAYLVLVDEATGFTVVSWCKEATAAHYASLVTERWIAWAGPPERLVADGERGFASVEFTGAMARAGTAYTPPAAYAPWQKGKVERRNATVRSIIRKSALHMGLKGQTDMEVSGWEAASAINQRPGASGVSPALVLFGQKMRLYGELYPDPNDEPVRHPDSDDASSLLARRFKIRLAARQAIERHYAKEAIRRSVAARTRTLEKVVVGQSVFFYRQYTTQTAIKAQSARGCYLGPALVIGQQGKNVWLSYAGRCYLVAL
jgi:hypothetical protein